MRKIFSHMSARGAALLGTATLSSLLLAAAPQAHAAADPGFYRAELVTPVEARRAIVRNAVFSCDGASCMGSKANSRPYIVCAEFVREFGAADSFVAGGEALDADALAKCNKWAD